MTIAGTLRALGRNFPGQSRTSSASGAAAIVAAAAYGQTLPSMSDAGLEPLILAFAVSVLAFFSFKYPLTAARSRSLAEGAANFLLHSALGIGFALFFYAAFGAGALGELAEPDFRDSFPTVVVVLLATPVAVATFCTRFLVATLNLQSRLNLRYLYASIVVIALAGVLVFLMRAPGDGRSVMVATALPVIACGAILLALPIRALIQHSVVSKTLIDIFIFSSATIALFFSADILIEHNRDVMGLTTRFFLYTIAAYSLLFLIEMIIRFLLRIFANIFKIKTKQSNKTREPSLSILIPRSTTSVILNYSIIAVPLTWFLAHRIARTFSTAFSGYLDFDPDTRKLAWRVGIGAGLCQLGLFSLPMLIVGADTAGFGQFVSRSPIDPTHVEFPPLLMPALLAASTAVCWRTLGEFSERYDLLASRDPRSPSHP